MKFLEKGIFWIAWQFIRFVSLIDLVSLYYIAKITFCSSINVKQPMILWRVFLVSVFEMPSCLLSYGKSVDWGKIITKIVEVFNNQYGFFL